MHDAFADVPIDMKSCTFNIGLIMLSLMEGTDRSMQHSTERLVRKAGYEQTYSVVLESLMRQYLEVRKEDRPGLLETLYWTNLGLARWEKAYGDVKGVDVQGFAGIRFQEEEFRIGEKWPGRKGKRREPEPESAEKRERDTVEENEVEEVDAPKPNKKRVKASPKYKG